jgi:hypothetical protein
MTGLHLRPAPRLLLTGDAAEDRRRRQRWRHLYAGGPPTPRQRELAELRHRANLLTRAEHLERGFQWQRTARRLRAVGIRL